MANGKKVVRKTGGPFIASAVFCESIIQEGEGTLSIVRITDGCEISIHQDAPPDFPSETDRARITQHALVAIKTGDAPGKHILKIVVESPTGKRKTIQDQEVTLTPEPNGGINIKMFLNLEIAFEGMYWFDVIVDGKRITRMPLNIKFQRFMPEKPNAKKRNSKRA